jgi:hypothetical protein
LEVVVVLNSGGIYSLPVHEFEGTVYGRGLREIEELVCTAVVTEEEYVKE